MTAAAIARILVIDDEPQIRKFLRISLNAYGYEVIEAVRGEDGIAKCATASPDLVILDLGLPDLDGQQVITQHPRVVQDPDHRAFGAGGRGREGGGARPRRRRLRDQTVRHPRAAGAGARGAARPAAGRRTAAGGNRRSAISRSTSRAGTCGSLAPRSS